MRHNHVDTASAYGRNSIMARSAYIRFRSVGSDPRFEFPLACNSFIQTCVLHGLFIPFLLF